VACSFSKKAGLIKLQPNIADDATVEDVIANPKHLRFIELEAAQLPRALHDVTLAQVSLSYLVMSGGDPSTALISDGAGNPHYALNFVVREDHRYDPRILRFVPIYCSPRSEGIHYRTLWQVHRAGLVAEGFDITFYIR
jgi:D-methionine transport system substrate-binding protein